jgi:hypothetical protein
LYIKSCSSCFNCVASSLRSGFEQPIVRATIAHNIIRYNKRFICPLNRFKVKNPPTRIY